MLWLTTLTILTNINQCNIEKNNIDNTCDFEKIRILKKDIKCIDTGHYTKYCNHYALPNEFIITKEKGIGNSENIIIKPEGIFTETDHDKQQIARFYYNFECYNENGSPNLELIIYPRWDTNPIWSLILIIFIIIIAFFLIAICDSPNDRRRNSDFTWGYVLGSCNSGGSRSRTYCE